jgi:microcin C transport system permease protein
MKLSSVTQRKIAKFRGLRRGYYSFIAFTALLVFAAAAELFINNRALVVQYKNELLFPTYGDVIPGIRFGLEYEYETNYRELQTKLKTSGEGWVVMPLVPWGQLELDLDNGASPPHPPSLEKKHYLGTDTMGRDVLARLVYGFRVAIVFSLLLLVASYGVGIVVGCLMGYMGGWFDILVQRVIEIWDNVPVLYVIIILASIVQPNFYSLIVIMIFFNWTSMTAYMRALTYKEKARDYVMAAKSLGCSMPRIILHHILPNTLSVVVTFIPFSVASGIVALTSLDFLGFGLPPPAPSWGELLQQGTSHLDAKWIIISILSAMVAVLSLITFIGEAVREAFDPRNHIVYL